MKLLRWAVIGVLSFLSGILFVQYLSVHPLQMSLYLVATCVALFALILVLAFGFKRLSLFIAIGLSLGLFIAGHLMMTRIILNRPDPRPVPELTRSPGDPGLGHTAVVYFTHGEPETYNPIGWINQFNEFDEQEIDFIPMIARPFFFNALRNKYLEVGKSGHRMMHGQMIEALEAAYRAEGDQTTKFYLSFLDDNPRPDAAAIQALNEGASRIIVSEVFLTISNHTAEGEHQINELEIEDRFNIPVIFTGPLYDSDLLKSMFVERANANIGDTPKDKVGILLVGHGQPDEWDVEWPTETEHEIGFRMDVIALLIADGYDPDNVSLAWMEFKEPKPAEIIEVFLDNGIEKLLFFSAAISADSIHSQYDTPELVYEADFPEGFPVINLGAWNADPIVISAIKEKIDTFK
jgi:sirohydrochlorin ferrochelatase